MTNLIELVKTISDTIPAKYSNGELSIQEFIKEYDKALNGYSKATIDAGFYDDRTDYQKGLDHITFKLGKIVEQMQLKKLMNNKQDGLVLVEYLKENVNELEKFFKEEK